MEVRGNPKEPLSTLPKSAGRCRYCSKSLGRFPTFSDQPAILGLFSTFIKLDLGVVKTSNGPEADLPHPAFCRSLPAYWLSRARAFSSSALCTATMDIVGPALAAIALGTEAETVTPRLNMRNERWQWRLRAAQA